MTYQEQLRHPLWQKRRLEVMASHDFKCEKCGDKETTLNVHHKRYDYTLKLWEYPDHDLSCLCENCHSGLNCCIQLLYVLKYDIETKMKYLAPIEPTFCVTCGKSLGA